MTLQHKNYFSCSILILGFLSFCYYINSLEFVAASITMLSSVLLWVAFNVHHDMFNKFSFAKVLCGSGVLLSISTFFLFAIEEVPFPEGALLFHSEGIAITLFVILLSVIPILFLSDMDIVGSTMNSQSAEALYSETTSEDEAFDNDWEIATDEDLESGEYEAAA